MPYWIDQVDIWSIMNISRKWLHNWSSPYHPLSSLQSRLTSRSIQSCMHYSSFDSPKRVTSGNAHVSEDPFWFDDQLCGAKQRPTDTTSLSPRTSASVIAHGTARPECNVAANIACDLTWPWPFPQVAISKHTHTRRICLALVLFSRRSHVKFIASIFGLGWHSVTDFVENMFKTCHNNYSIHLDQFSHNLWFLIVFKKTHYGFLK